MTVKLAIRESVTEAPVKKGNRWRVIVARPGQGSSGFYSEDLFRRDAEKIIAPGGQAFINHDDSRNPKDMLGTYPDGSFWSEEDHAVVSELEVFSHWKEFVEEVGPHCGISLYALGEADEEGNVTAIKEDRLNGADLVSRPGLIGSGLAEKLYESATAQTVVEPPAKSAAERKDNEMDEKVIEGMIASAIAPLLTKIDSLVADKESTKVEKAQVEADATAIAEALERFEASVKAIDEADLLAPQREALLSAAKRGEDIASAIESAKAVKEAAEEAVSGRLSESAGARDFGAGTQSKFGAWK